LSIDEDNGTTCPHCGAVVPSGNAYCGKCGASISSAPHVSRDQPMSSTGTYDQRQRPRPPTYPKYDRKFSFFERITKLLTSPDEAMEDIGLSPDYGGVIGLFVIWTIISIIGIALALPKLQFVGTYGDVVTSGVMSGVVLAVVLSPIIMIVRWLVKSYLVRHMTDSNSWNFETAAAVTGYAYLPNVLLNIVGILVAWVLIPPIIIDTTNLTTALAQMEAYNVSIMWVSIGLNSILAIVGLIWKSSLGSYGTYYGTHKNIAKDSAFGTFLILGFIGFLIDFVSNFL
jgi:hypothetical protein